MKILGLTGAIASGKTTVANMFKSLGAELILADRVAHQIYQPKEEVYQKIIQRYGKGILNSKKQIDRKKLSKKLFFSKKEKKRLESMIHPATFKKIGWEIQKAIHRRPPLILVEAALHFETNYYRFFEGIIVVKSPLKKIKKRLEHRDQLSNMEIEARIINQWPLSKKLKKADWIIDNSENLEKTERQVRKLFKTLIRNQLPTTKQGLKMQ